MNRIQLFEWVRDIPYKIATDVRCPDYCCLTKPVMLQRLLKTIGIKSRIMICEFLWQDLALPRELLKLATRTDETHAYLEVLIPETNKWVEVDPTWDKEMTGSCFPLAEWDGRSPTQLAVKPTKVWPLEKTQKLFDEWDCASIEEKQKQLDTNKVFFEGFNNYIEHVRARK